MIKVGIIGGESLLAGELVRLLVLHQEVELETVYSPSLSGRCLTSYYKGITGDTALRFSDSIQLENLDLIFVASEEYDNLSGATLDEDLKVIYLQTTEVFNPKPPLKEINFIPGLSEMFRKPLVRHAKGARVLPTPTAIAIIALFPLALHLLLNNSLEIRIGLPEYGQSSLSGREIKKEIETILHSVQLSFEEMHKLSIEKNGLIRTVSFEAEFDCNVSVSEIERIFEETYDDHNFSFLEKIEPSASEVAGTQKCLIYVSCPKEGRIKIKALADGFLRGGAGDAVHAMNLLFGLHEKTGLSFPASMAFKNEEIEP